MSKAVYGSWKEEVACDFACRKRKLSKGPDSKVEGCACKAMGATRILELLEGGVGGDGVGHVLCPLYSELVELETANEEPKQSSRGLDTFWAGVQAAHTRGSSRSCSL